MPSLSESSGSLSWADPSSPSWIACPWAEGDSRASPLPKHRATRGNRAAWQGWRSSPRGLFPADPLARLDPGSSWVAGVKSSYSIEKICSDKPHVVEEAQEVTRGSRPGTRTSSPLCAKPLLGSPCFGTGTISPFRLVPLDASLFLGRGKLRTGRADRHSKTCHILSFRQRSSNRARSSGVSIPMESFGERPTRMA